MNESASQYDCVIIGGGPGGLTAAEYLGRFLRHVIVIDGGKSRAALIPRTHNYPGFPEGIAGTSLLQRLRKQVTDLNIPIVEDEVISLTKSANAVFETRTAHHFFQSPTVILATGIVDDQPHIPSVENFIYSGVVRYCPICDGFEVKDKRIGIIGPCHKIYKKAFFLRTYSSRITLFPLDGNESCQSDIPKLRSLEISVPEHPIENLIIRDDGVTGVWADGTQCDVDILYPAMGAKVRIDFLQNLPVAVNDTGCVFTDMHQQTNIENLYAIGDITLDLSQISVATGQAAIAATSVHNSLPLNCRI